MTATLRPALAIIPARGGSKGVPGKNLQRLGGRTLVSLAVSCAQRTMLFDRIVVSTEDDEIAREAVAAGAEVMRRPDPLASDEAPVVDAIADTLEQLASTGFVPEVVLLLEPSSPLRTPEMVERAMVALTDVDAAFTVTQVPLQHHAAKQFMIEPNGIAVSACATNAAPPRRQDLRRTYFRNGAAYAFRVSMFTRERSVLGSAPRAVIIDEELVNIDEVDDLARARRLFGRDA